MIVTLRCEPTWRTKSEVPSRVVIRSWLYD
jgi:hypothetical protein